MKPSPVLFLVFGIFLSACGPSNEQNDEALQETALSPIEVQGVLSNWLDLWETYDLNMLESVFIQSDDLTYFSSEKEGLIQGYEMLHPHHRGFGFIEGGKEPVKSLWLEDIETRIYSESAMVGAVWYFGDRTMPMDSISNGPVTFIMIRDTKGQLKIMHTHFANY